MRRTVMGAFLVVAADITVLLALVRLVSLLVHHAAAVGTKEYALSLIHIFLSRLLPNVLHLLLYFQ